MTSSTVPPIRWAVLGPGSIARRFVSQLSSCPGASLVAVGSSDRQRAGRFAAEQAPGADVHLGSYDEILADPGVDAVYVATVHTDSPALTIAAARGRQARPVREAAGAPTTRRRWPWPTSARAAARCWSRRTCTASTRRPGACWSWSPRARSATCCTSTPASPSVPVSSRPAVRPRDRRRRHPRRRRLPRLLRAGDRRRGVGRAVLEPTAVTARGTLGPTGVDEWAVADLAFPGGVTASVRTGVRLAGRQHGDDLRLARADLHLADPWTLGRRAADRDQHHRAARPSGRVRRRPAVRAGGRRPGRRATGTRRSGPAR